jgi:hypothetical protein
LDIRDQSKEVFLKFFDASPDDPRKFREGVYSSTLFKGDGEDKSVMVIAMDMRYSKDPYEVKGSGMLLFPLLSLIFFHFFFMVGDVWSVVFCIFAHVLHSFVFSAVFCCFFVLLKYEYRWRFSRRRAVGMVGRHAAKL